jgi:transcriptional regulator with XRE-family HTH domain
MDNEMRSASLSTTQAKAIASLLKNRRTKLGLSMRLVCRQSGLNIATLSQLEAATNLSPQPHTFKALARALKLPVSDLYAVADWLPAAELPSFRHYLRASYQDLSEEAIAEVEGLVSTLRSQRHSSKRVSDEEVAS